MLFIWKELAFIDGKCCDELACPLGARGAFYWVNRTKMWLQEMSLECGLRCTFGNRSCGGGRGAAFPCIKVSSIKMHNSNVINNLIVAWHLVFFQALPWNPNMQAGQILLLPCYELSNVGTGLTGPVSKESADKQVSVS